ncbi:zinc finger CCHC domain-containing protein 14 [Dermacentor albipictus]|uniref:zinc finger CCHC domain-containing protein 14 n=1 Tax=Dermacentor albipictus TaxID=60249 RepID=UPI0031FCEFC4
MVCKEEIYSWFKQLNGAVRIDTMCGLLNLCLPFELRFLGTCVEDLASKDYAYFREAELRANNFNELSKCTNVRDAVSRSKLITSLALLHLSNRSCSHAIFEALSEEMKCAKQETYDTKTLEEMLLLFTMATHHPSFSFDERSEFVKFREKLESLWAAQGMAVAAPVESYMVPCMPYTVPFMPPYPVTADAVASPPYVQGCSRPHNALKARLSSIEVKPEPQCKRSVKLSLQWSDRHQTEVVRSFQEISGLSQKLSRLSASDPSCSGKAIPQLPACIEKNEELDGMFELSEYFNWVASLPPSYLENELVGPFFEPTPCGKLGFAPSAAVVPETTLPLAPDDPRVGLLAFYGGGADAPIASAPPLLAPAVGSMMPPMVGPSVNCAGQGTEHAGPSPCNSPLSSAPASPYESPPTSGCNSRATSPWTGAAVTRMHWDGTPSSVEELLHRAHLKKYHHLFKNCTLDDVLAMSEDSMKHKGLPASCSRRLVKEIALLKSHTNGLLCSRAVNAGTAAAFSHASGESSTTSCSSECSSPSPPPALKAVRTHSPASSGSDDSTQPSTGSAYVPSCAKWPAACEATETAASVVPPEAARLGSQPPSVMPIRYAPPGSVLVEPQHRFLLLTDRPTYGPSRAPVRALAPVVKTTTDGVPHSNPAVTTTAAFGPMYSVGIMPAGMFPQHSFPPFLHAGHQSNGYLSFLSGAGYVAPPTTAAAYVPLATFGGPSVVVPPPPTSAKVASCYNCGLVGHRGHECKEATVEEATKSAQFRLHFAPAGAAPEAQP